MLRLAICLLFLHASSPVLADPSVLPDTVELIADDQPFGDFRITVIQESAEVTAAWFSYDYEPETSVGEIEFTSVTLDEGSDWYLVREGDFFTPEGIEAGDYVPLAEFGPTFFGPATVDRSFWSNDPFPQFPDIDLPDFASAFYLAFATNVGFDDLTRDVFGWVQLRAIPPLSTSTASIELVNSATAYDSGGIVVGTLQAIPEPHACALALFAALPAGARRRR